MTDTAPTESSPEEGGEPVARMADDLEKIAGHLIPFLKASYAETQDRLKRAERVIAARQERPAIAGMHALLSRLRRSAPGADLKAVMEEELVKLLEGLGYQEFGSPGDAYDPLRHEPVAGQTDRGKGRLSTVHRKGLACYDDVMIRAVVEVEVAGGEVPPDVNEAFPLPGDHVVVGATGQSHQSSEGG